MAIINLIIMGEIFRKVIAGHTVYAIWEISETADELLAGISLRPEEESLYLSFLAEERKKQWLAYRILIRSLLKPDDFPILYDETGKPYLAGSSFHISVTHSHELAAVIISSQGRVGIDIEKIRPKIIKVKDKFLNEQETAAIQPPDNLALLTLGWCAKEALYKLYGKRNLDFRENILLKFPESPENANFEGLIKNGPYQKGYILTSDIFRDFVMVVVLENAN